MTSTRRDALRLGTLTLGLVPTFKALGATPGKLAQAPSMVYPEPKAPTQGGFDHLPMTATDTLDVPPGFDVHIIGSKGTPINTKGETLGDCCDYLHFLPESETSGLLWINHEYICVPLLYKKKVKGADKTKEQVDAERKLVGGALVELTRKDKFQPWTLKQDSTRAFRVDGNTSIPLAGAYSGKSVIGTMGNCSGGFTPWGTVLSGEENVHHYYDESSGSYYGWNRFYDMNPEDYGYIVEIDPRTQKARKLTSLGKFAHEGCCIHVAKSGHVVAYMGDDARFEHLYKYVSKGKITDANKDNLLVDGTLYVADVKNGKWEELTPSNPKIKSFKTQKDIVVNARQAAKEVGATPLNRPEGIVVDPESGAVLVALTNNSKSGDFHGSIFAVHEDGGEHSSTKFRSHTVIRGGAGTGFSCPDNVVMGPGNFLWAGMDVSSTSMGKGVYADYPRNGLYRIEGNGFGGLSARRFLLSPFGAEVTGPCFASDGSGLFVAIQHPGEGSYVKGNGLISHWPGGGNSDPLSTVVLITAKEGHSF